nr:retrovirus-related Pol polyprotein from transposon TNT 1-94 [Tanacetum cinerariifolium]
MAGEESSQPTQPQIASTKAPQMVSSVKLPILKREGLDKGYDRFQRLLSLLEIHRVGVSTEDANKKFHKSLPSAWSNISLIMRNKTGIDNLDIDDLYNNLKVYKVDIKGSFRLYSNSQNVAFVSGESTNSTNELNAAYSVSTATGHSSHAQEEEAIDFAPMAFTSNPSSSPSLNSKEEVIKTVFDNRSSDKENSVANDRFKKGEGYHEVPPPLTGNYMPPKPELSFARIDDSIYKFKISETVTSLAKDEKDAPKTSTAYVEKPKEDRKVDESVKHVKPVEFVKHGHPQKALKNKGIVDSGYPRHITGNKAYLVTMEVFLLLVQVEFNLFSVSQICDKKNNVLFTKTECLVLSPNLKLLDESQVLLRVPRTPQQNGVAKRKNRTLIEAAKTMLADSLLPVIFWAEAVNTACYVFNRALVKKTHNKTPYELLNGRSPRLDFMRPFGSLVTILNIIDPLGKFEGPQDTNGNAGTQDNVDVRKEMFDQHYIMLPLWSSISSTYKSSDDKPADDKPKDDTGFKTVEESINKEDQAYRDKLDRLMSQEKEASDAADALKKEFEQGCVDKRGVTQAGSTNSFNTVKETAELQSTSIFNSAYDDDLDIYISPVQSVGAEDEFNNMESFAIVRLIPTHKMHIDHPKDQILGDPKSAVQIRGWQRRVLEHMLLNKKDEKGIVVRNKAKLVAQGYRQEEGMDYDEVFTSVAMIEATRIFLAFASFIGFIVYQMDVKSAFLYDTIKEEVYDKYVAEILKKFDFSSVKIASTPIETQKPLVKDETSCLQFVLVLGFRDSPFDLEAYSDSDYARANLDRKSTTEDSKFVDQHNMVACLEKIKENAEFYQIVDFLSTCLINYALTVSPTVYASYIEQFRNTVISKTFNSVKQIHAIVDGKAVVISESSVRSDIVFNDEDGIACLTNAKNFENLALMGYEKISTKLTFQKGSFSPQ